MTSSLPTTMPRLSAVVFSALIGAAIALPAAAQWKWRDTTGQIQYSDLPPPTGVSDHDILQRPLAVRHRYAAAPASSASMVAAAPKTVDPALEAKRRQAEQEQQAKQKAEEQKQAAGRAENC